MISCELPNDSRFRNGDDMMTLLRLVVGIGILLIFASSVHATDEPDQEKNPVNPPQANEDPLTTELRARIKSRTPEAGGYAFNHPTITFEKFADEFGLEKSRRTLIKLLRDPDLLIRDEAATVAMDWLTVDNLDEETFQAMLLDSSAEVRRVALVFLSESRFNLEPLFRIAADEQSDLRNFAIELLPELILKGNDEAKRILSELITSKDVQIAGHAIRLVGGLGVKGRFAESKLRDGLADEREFTNGDPGESFSIKQLANEALRETGFDDEATAKALQNICDSSKEKFADELPCDQGLWLNAATTLAVCRCDFTAVREAIFMRWHGSYEYIWMDTEAIRVLLDLAPDAITAWEHGERICRRLLSTPAARNWGDNWTALEKYPNAATVFEPEMQKLLEDEAANDDPSAFFCPFKEVIALRASDGFSREDLNYSLRLIGIQRRSTTDAAIHDADAVLSEVILSNDLQLTAEIMMLSLVHSPSVNPEQFRELLEQLPAQEKAKSRSRRRLEATLDGVDEPR